MLREEIRCLSEFVRCVKCGNETLMPLLDSVDVTPVDSFELLKIQCYLCGGFNGYAFPLDADPDMMAKAVDVSAHQLTETDLPRWVSSRVAASSDPE